MAALRRPLPWLLLLALLLRLAVALERDPLRPYTPASGGDEAWYMANGWGLMSGQPHGSIRGITFYIEVLPGAPAYLVLVGLPQMFLPDAAATRVIFMLQALLGVALCYFAAHSAICLSGRYAAGVLVAGVLAVMPSLVQMTGWILTETLYLFLVTGALWLYLRRVLPAARSQQVPAAALALVGALFGVAVLTRAVLLLFPALVALHLLALYGRGGWRRGLAAAALLLLSYSATVGTWTLTNWLQYQRFVIGSTQMMPALWRGAVTTDASPEAMDSVLMADCTTDCRDAIPAAVYQQQLTATVLGDAGGFVQTRLGELAAASLEPFGAAEMGGDSLRALALHWLRADFSFAGLLRLVNAEHFWYKLALYLLHYGGIVAGLAGLWQQRRNWPAAALPAAFIAYTYALHLLLLALPRYIFPSQVYWWIFAAIALASVRPPWSARLKKDDDHARTA